MHATRKQNIRASKGDSQAPLVKKPRGRPRKHPLPTPTTPVSDDRVKTAQSTSGPGTDFGSVASTSGAEPQTQAMVVSDDTKLNGSARHMRNLAEKMRRDKLNTYVSELASIIPLVSSASKKVDKTSVLRIAANYIRLHNVIGGETTHKPLLPTQFGSEAAAGIIEALGNRFLLVATNTGKIVYVSDAVEEFFGHSQLELLGSSLFPIIHPDDQDLVKSQLSPKESTRRSFFCRMAERVLTRNESRRYEIVHIQGRFRPIPPPALPTPSVKMEPAEEGTSALMSLGETSPPVRHRRSTRHYGSLNLLHSEDDSSGSEEARDRKAWPRIPDTHLLVALVQLIKERPITELSRMEAMKDEYITRHDVYGNILYTDHRISVVTGHMPEAVRGTPAIKYMHSNDLLWSLLAQKHMLGTDQGQGRVSYRLRCSDNRYITLRSRGFLEFCKQTGKFESFVCINSVISEREAEEEIRSLRRKLLPVYSGYEANSLLSTITSELPAEIVEMIQKTIGCEQILQILNKITGHSSSSSSLSSSDASGSCDLMRDSEVDKLAGPSSQCLTPTKPKKSALATREKQNTLTRGEWKATTDDFPFSNSSRKRSIEESENFNNKRNGSATLDVRYSGGLAEVSFDFSSSNNFNAAKHPKIVDLTDTPEIEELMSPNNGTLCGSSGIASDLGQIHSPTSAVVMSPKLDFCRPVSTSAVDSMTLKSSHPSTTSYKGEERSPTQSTNSSSNKPRYYDPACVASLQVSERYDQFSDVHGSAEIPCRKPLYNSPSCQLNNGADGSGYKAFPDSLLTYVTPTNELSSPEEPSPNVNISSGHNEPLLSKTRLENVPIESTKTKHALQIENSVPTQSLNHSKSLSEFGRDFSSSAENVLCHFNNPLNEVQTPATPLLPTLSCRPVFSTEFSGVLSASDNSTNSHGGLPLGITDESSTLLNNCDLWSEQRQLNLTIDQQWGVRKTPDSPIHPYSRNLTDRSSRGKNERIDDSSSMVEQFSVTQQDKEQKELLRQIGSGPSHSPPRL